MRIEFVIDELVLVGFDPRERHRMADALARGLERRATAADVLPLVRAGGTAPTLRGADVVFPSATGGVPSAGVGDRVGNSIVTGLAGIRSEVGGPFSDTVPVKQSGGE